MSGQVFIKTTVKFYLSFFEFIKNNFKNFVFINFIYNFATQFRQILSKFFQIR